MNKIKLKKGGPPTNNHHSPHIKRGSNFNIFIIELNVGPGVGPSFHPLSPTFPPPSPAADNAGQYAAAEMIGVFDPDPSPIPAAAFPAPPPRISGRRLMALPAPPNPHPSSPPSAPLPGGRHLRGERAVYDVDERRPGELRPQLEVVPITRYNSEPVLTLGRRIAVNRRYICYGLKYGAIRVLNINTALRSLLRGHSEVRST